MKHKRYIYVVLLIGFLPFSCWKTESRMYFMLHNISAKSYQEEALHIPMQQTDTIVNDKVFFKLNFNISYLASTNYTYFENGLFATSVPRKGQDGLKEKLTDITIVSDKLFKGRLPGTVLNDLFSWHDIQWDNQLKEINDLKNILNKTEIFLGSSVYDVKLILNQKPNDSLSHKFTFTFAYSDGSAQSTTTNKINWK